ncbi:MAG: hypothetical protein Kow0042_11960 [Calditrichia bacterium]
MISEIKIPDTTAEVLKMALEMEQEGRDTYLEGASKISNSMGKRLLERLADDELIHMRRIREAYEAIEGKRDWDKVTMKNEGERPTFQSIFNRLKAELNQSIDELGSHGVDDEEIIETAINLENHAKFYYSQAAEKAEDAKVKEFLNILAQEEETHYQALRKINGFMADPANWFATQGKF